MTLSQRKNFKNQIFTTFISRSRIQRWSAELTRLKIGRSSSFKQSCSQRNRCRDRGTSCDWVFSTLYRYRRQQHHVMPSMTMFLIITVIGLIGFFLFFFNWNSFQELLSHCYCWLSVVITIFCLIKSKWTLQLSVVTVISCLVFLPNKKDSWSCYETGSVVAKLLLCVLMSYRLGWGGSIKQRNLRLFSSSSSGQQSSSCPCHNW